MQGVLSWLMCWHAACGVGLVHLHGVVCWYGVPTWLVCWVGVLHSGCVLVCFAGVGVLLPAVVSCHCHLLRPWSSACLPLPRPPARPPACTCLAAYPGLPARLPTSACPPTYLSVSRLLCAFRTT